ncbi:MAG: chorismate synthase [Candidatus Omnitrophica bacterium]|nr:chorismate synthase [Candidatus Omnitrophota bacterium]
MRYMTAGESHGEQLVSIVDGMPADIKIDEKFLNNELSRRMVGYGRGGRMKIEKDKVHIVSGIRKGKTIGSPVSIIIKNKDFKIKELPPIFNARPGHADLAGALKYNQYDMRNMLERSSARETAEKVAVGALCKLLLKEFNIDMLSHVLVLGNVGAYTDEMSYEQIKKAAESADIRCADKKARVLMKEEIDKARQQGDSLGGICEVVIKGVPVGLGTYTQWDRRLDGEFAKALMSIQAVKGVEIGGGFELAFLRGSQVHDEIFYDKKNGFRRITNNAGGIEAGMSNGEYIVLRVAMKPIATLMSPLSTVNVKTKKEVSAQVERADVCAVSACGVVAEAVSAYVIANAMVEKFGGDSIGEMKRNYESYLKQVKNF